MKAKSLAAASLLAFISNVYAEVANGRIETLWPLCTGWKTNLEQWQWITPSELTAADAARAVAGLSAVEGKRIEGEAAMIFRMNLQILEGYKLLVVAKEDAAGFPADSIGMTNHRKAVHKFCMWITTNAFPE